MPNTLKAMDLDIERKIDISTPRIACVQPYSISDREKPKSKIGATLCILTHIRNAFAHGNTYFFDNGFMLLEDKNGSIITARMVLLQSTLIDWVKLIDCNRKYYSFVDLEYKESEELLNTKVI